MKLSIIVPVYNAERYLGRCLYSLLCQDIPTDQYEILCIDDGSTDFSFPLLKVYEAAYPNVRVLHKENGGVTTARNLGLEAAQGTYIWFVDADDVVRENLLGRLMDAIEASGCDRLVVDGYAFVDQLNPADTENADALPRNTPWQDAVVWRNLLRRDFLREHHLHFAYPELTHGEDGLFMYEVGAASPKTTETGIMAYFYQVHSGSAETSTSLDSHRRKLRSYLRLTQIMDGYYKSGRKDPGTVNKLMSFLWFSLYEAARLPKQEARQALDALGKLGLYPGKRLPECTMERAYLVSGPGIIGTILDQICLNLQSPWAYHTLRLLLKLKK